MPDAIMPKGSFEKAQKGLSMLKDAVLELIIANPGGITHAEIVSHLELHSDYGGRHKNYLSWSILGLLIGEKKIRRCGERQRARYFSNV